MTAVTVFNIIGFDISKASFIDVSNSDQHLTAINYLQASGIIQGYPDGTFQPERAVNRAEFLKLALKTYNIPTDINTPTGFKDTDENAWYAPYLRKAKKEGWIQGYPDGTFKPTQTVNKVEGLKIIGNIASWNLSKSINADQIPFKDISLSDWFTPYVVYGKQQNFLEDFGDYFIPSAGLFRGQVSEILFRNLIVTQTKSSAFTNDLYAYAQTHLPTPQPDSPQTPIVDNFESITYQTYKPDYFNNIILNDSFPNIFYLNEVYYLEGSIKSGTYQQAFAFIKNTSDGSTQNYISNVSNNTFKIKVIFKKAGNYNLGIIPGDSGQSKIVPISVISNLPNPGSQISAQAPNNQKVEYKNQQTTFYWDNASNNLSKLIIFQGSESKTYFSRQTKNSFDIDYSDLKNFRPGSVNFQIKSAKSSQTKPLKIDTAWTTGTTSSFNATTHTFSELHPDQISYNSLPEIMNAPGNISISGMTKTDIFEEALVTKPNGLVDSIKLTTSQPLTSYLGANIIPQGHSYSLNYNVTQNGTYIVEINGKNGSAVINTPVYVGNGIPLIPDFFDLAESEQKIQNFNINNLRSQLLNLINDERAKAGFKMVNADPDLNTLAQNHANDMSKRKFFGHINPDGNSPEDRRIALQIPTAVGENLAQAPNLLYAHNGLLRSPIHRQNLLQSDWERVGLGFAQDSQGGIYVVEEFSTYPLTLEKINTIKSDLINTINAKRSSVGVQSLNNDSTLSAIASNWSANMVEQNFYGFTAPDNTTITGVIQNAGFTKGVDINILQSNSITKLAETISSLADSLSAKWTIIGVGLNVDNLGILKLTALYST